MTFVTTPSTRQELVSLFQSKEYINLKKLVWSLEELLEFELYNCDPIRTSGRFENLTKEPPADCLKLLDLFRQTFTWNENYSLRSTVQVECETYISVRCQDREHLKEMMFLDDVSEYIEIDDRLQDDGEITYLNPFNIVYDLEVSSTIPYKIEVAVTNLNLKETPDLIEDLECGSEDGYCS